MAKLLLRRRVTFDAAHHLPLMPPGHKCRNVHGHTYTLIVGVEGDVSEESGMVRDFGELKLYTSEVVKALDHQDLNTLMENPTAEAILLFCRTRLLNILPEGLRLVELEVQETPACSVAWRGT